jgi:hypothetical protein
VVLPPMNAPLALAPLDHTTAAEALDHAALSFQSSERLLGFLFVGTPQSKQHAATRPERSAHVCEWTGPSSNRSTAN